ncbi:PHP domain-containing protein [Bacillus stercoris]|uniref:PHP domain-containing protein n=1 Tax=Bacillus stercoris TaxID=2054641 RepID=UPI0022033EB8|nr:PHP domain-containing protein [Bacillus phage PK-3]
MDNYVMYHDHSDISNLTAGTGADSITKYQDYIDYAEKLGMSALAISEHGSVMNWIKKKASIEKVGMKYIHANEVYLTKKIEKEMVKDEETGLYVPTGKLNLERDNYHYMLIAKNYEGVKEINNLTSKSFSKEDGHFYYNPRITFDELKATSDNVIMTSACLASPLWRLFSKANSLEEAGKVTEAIAINNELEDLLNWMGDNRHRMFFEIQYHSHPEQIAFNQWLLMLSKELKIPLIAGTDTHALNQEHAKARQLFLKSKNANYGDEDSFDLTMKSYPELVEMFEKQNALPRNVYLEAIHNTNVMADMVEEFKLDKTPKYPKLYDKPIEVFQNMINEGVKKRGIDKFPKEKKQLYFKRIKEEFDTYKKLNAIDYMLLQKNIIDWCHSNDIYQGYGRGSVNGSLIAYILGITEMDSIKHKLNFFRFLNPDRISLPDIDIDFPPSRRQEVIDYLATLEGVEFAEIITFNTFALKGAIREMGRSLDMPLDEVDMIAKAVETFNGKDRIDDKWKNKYPELFKYVELFTGVIFAMGSHPSGFIVSPISLEDHVSTLYTKESKYRVTSVNMKELDGENYVKLDILGLANIELINETCKLAGIDRLTPDNIDTSDMAVWKSLRESTLGVFQFESDSAYAYLKQLFSDETLKNIRENVGDVDYIELLSLANGAIRPSGDSYRYDLAQGKPKDNGHPALNKSLADTMGYLVYQEQIMRFLTDFCEHTGAESDTVRRGLAKKEGTEQFLPKIHDGFIKFMKENYNEPEEHAEEILKSFLKVIEDAQRYGFSVNHSSPYSFTGYAGAWLRYHYPLEFLTTILNVMKDEKVGKIMEFAKKNNFEIKPISFGRSRAYYAYNKEEKAVYKGIASIKYLNKRVAEELYELSQKKEYDRNDWVGLLVDIFETSIDARQMEILIRLDFFKEFGEKEVLLEVYLAMADKKKADINKYPEFADKKVIEKKVNKKTGEVTEKEKTIKQPLKYDMTHIEKTKAVRLENLRRYEKAVRENPPRKIELYEQIAFEKQNLGYAYSTWEEVDGALALVIDINKKYTPKITLYQIKTGREYVVKVKKSLFWKYDDPMLYVGDIIKVLEVTEEDGWKNENGKWKRNPAVRELHLHKCKHIRKSSQRKR